MEKTPRPPRKQNSSCDGCRASRIRCDAVHRREGGGAAVVGGLRDRRCTNCARKERPCTFKWLQVTKRRRRASSAFSVDSVENGEDAVHPPFDHEGDIHKGGRSVFLSRETSSSRSTASSRVARAFNLREDSIESSMWHIFSSVFETALGVWLGSGCCPYPGLPDGSRTIISRLFVSLDEWKCPCRGHDGQVETRHPVPGPGNVCVKADTVVNQALNVAVHAFSVRWLPLVAGTNISTDKLNDLARRLWQNARSKILLILQRRCYRSILALYIFGMTPVPPGLEDEDLSHGNIGEVCIDIAMRQLLSVRARRRQVNRSESTAMTTKSALVGAGARAGPAVDLSDTVDEGYQLRETIAYWAGFVFDTSASLTTGLPSILHASLLGFEQEGTVQLLQRTAQDFHDKTEPWRLNGFEVTNQCAIWIVQSASGCKGLFWKAVASLREAFNYRHEPHLVVRAQTAVVQCMHRYDVTYAPLLAACKRALLFLDFEAQLNWYLLALHYHLGLLILYDTLNIFDRRDLISNLSILQRAAVQETINIISLGMQCKFSLQTVFGSMVGSRRNDMVCLLSIDPYPHHVATALRLVSDFLKKHSSSSEVCPSSEALTQIRHIATMAFDQLPQCSASLQSSRTSVFADLNDVQQLQGSLALDTHEAPKSSIEQAHVQHDQGDGVHELREEDFQAIDGLDIEAEAETGTEPAYPVTDNLARDENLTSSVLLDQQWDWTSSDESPLGFEIPTGDMFLTDHGLFERESASEPGAPPLFLLVELVDWFLDVTGEDLFDDDDDDDDDDDVEDEVEEVWKRLAGVMGVVFMESTDLRAKKADAIVY
ncbi:hypothetical protein Z517_03597 [Fonsecaea pedrosoi CBS 271.37]|uniref:Unplaced genomic scaffold supercont1.2, whole genome shotgun sequence n=1 Tax=Fonsecaea pedrosoi CBS 271.37 TaxID=1442368 RepID=A0A0D2FCJ6_9EURO|nr:uncharacterized protein Z517_03597 [Fonsecaea pedrosoi CBS 271.37]KIW84347.1 hypothetical protein Z517_03597 [Fonsecaea pedrosoi CBS 271.37]